MSLSQYLSEVPTPGLFANSEPRSPGRPRPGCRASLGWAGEGTRPYLYRWLALATLLLATLSLAPRSAAQATIYVTTTTPGNTSALPGGPFCSLEEAIYAANFDNSVAIDAVEPDHFYATGCHPGNGDDKIVLQSGQTYTFSNIVMLAVQFFLNVPFNSAGLSRAR